MTTTAPPETANEATRPFTDAERAELDAQLAEDTFDRIDRYRVLTAASEAGQWLTEDQIAQRIKELRERAMAEHRAKAAHVDRRGWTQQQWVDDARKLMGDLNGSVTSLVNRHVLALLAEVKRLTALTAQCTCGTTYATYEGPEPDCPVHGAVRALNEATAELDRLRTEQNRAIAAELRRQARELREYGEDLSGGNGSEIDQGVALVAAARDLDSRADELDPPSGRQGYAAEGVA